MPEPARIVASAVAESHSVDVHLTPNALLAMYEKAKEAFNGLTDTYDAPVIAVIACPNGNAAVRVVLDTFGALKEMADAAKSQESP